MRRHLRTLSRSWALAAILCACRESGDLTQTIVWVDAEAEARATLAHVMVQAIGPTDPREPATSVETHKPVWPIKLVLAPKNGDTSRHFTLEVKGRDATERQLMTVRFATGFVANETRYATLLIHDACVKALASCRNDETCNVWSLQLAADDLGRARDQPRRLEVACATSPEPVVTSPDAGATGNVTRSDAASSDVDSGFGTPAGSGASVPGPIGTCDPGFVSGANGCVDIDDCAQAHPCGDHGRCENTSGGYSCHCDPGYDGQRGPCVEASDCQTDNGGCESTCLESSGHSACACPVGEWLKADRKSCGSFGPTQSLSAAGSTWPMQPQFAFDREGNGLAVWTQSDYQSTSLWTRRYVAGSGWAADATKLALTNPGTPSAPRLALGMSGRGVIVWVQTAAASRSIWAVGYTGLNFDEPRQLDGGGAADVSDPSVVFDDNGAGIAAWTQSDGTHSMIWTNRLSTDKGWIGAQPIDSATGDDAFGARVALDSQSNAHLVWTQYHLSATETPRSSPWNVRFDAALGRWSSPSQLDDSGTAGFPEIRSSGPNTDALAVWARITDGLVSIRASKHLPGAGWSDSISLASGGSDIRSAMPRVALSPGGGSAAIWTQFQIPTFQVWGSSYDDVLAHWSDEVSLSSAGCTADPTPQLELDPSGDGFGVWSEISGNSRVIRASRMQKGIGFGQVFSLSTDTTATPSQNSPVEIAVDLNGNAVAIWDVFQSGQYYVWSSSFE